MNPAKQILSQTVTDNAFDNYRDLIHRLDTLTDHLVTRHKAHLVCRAGCSLCCRHNIRISVVEAFWLKGWLAEAPITIKNRLRANLEDQKVCPLLDEDLCLLYTYRPVICRTHGLPHLYPLDDDDRVVDYCELNFTNIPKQFSFSPGETIDLENLNTALGAVNIVFLRDNPFEYKISPEERITIEDIGLFVLGMGRG